MASTVHPEAVDLLGRVTRFINELLTIDLNLPDEPGALTEAAMQAPNAVASLDRAKQLLIEIDGHFEPLGESDANSETGEDFEPTVEQEICDLVFFGLNQIRPCRRRLVRAIQGDNAVKMVARSGEAYRRLNHALTPIENAIARAVGKEPPTRVGWDLEISLQVRKLYADLRQELQLVPDSDDEQVREALISFVLRFDDLKERDEYRFLRFDDRIHLDNLLKSTRAWLREGSEGEAATGRNLWRELINLVELMRQISIRTELRTYDRQLIKRACTDLFDREPKPGTMPPYLKDELANLLGLDDELDWLIRNAQDQPPQYWEHCLRRLASRIGGE